MTLKQYSDMNKIYPSAKEGVKDNSPGVSGMISGFGEAGTLYTLMDALFNIPSTNQFLASDQGIFIKENLPKSGF